MTIICPYCKCKENWYISTSENEKVYQCMECSKYFKVNIIVPEFAYDQDTQNIKNNRK